MSLEDIMPELNLSNKSKPTKDKPTKDKSKIINEGEIKTTKTIKLKTDKKTNKESTIE